MGDAFDDAATILRFEIAKIGELSEEVTATFSESFAQDLLRLFALEGVEPRGGDEPNAAAVEHERGHQGVPRLPGSEIRRNLAAPARVTERAGVDRGLPSTTPIS
ncbi:MAG: hypothetical protein IAG13_04465 [Deltaproteobacteria bacterium]|nr:hypothetical protein [Nannocystaceae bacterium]